MNELQTLRYNKHAKEKQKHKTLIYFEIHSVYV